MTMMKWILISSKPIQINTWIISLTIQKEILETIDSMISIRCMEMPPIIKGSSIVGAVGKHRNSVNN